jgi:starvation-inducible DNA-binding protein
MPTNTKANPTYPTRIDLDGESRGELIELLNQQLADTLDLYTQSKQAHWNVKGLDFFQLHELFDKLAEMVFPFVDEIAERVTALGGAAAGTVRMSASNSRLPEYPADLPEGRQHVEALAERWAAYAKNNRDAIDQADELDDQATADLFTQIQRDIDKGLYFLEAHLQKTRE